MKKSILFAALPAFALAACGEPATDEVAADDTTIVEPADTTTVEPAMPADTAAAGDADGTSITANEDGVSVDTTDGNTSISADIDENPSATVETD